MPETEGEFERKLFPDLGGVIALVAAVTLMQVLVGLAIYLALDTWAERAAVGDMFGAANALFSGLALAGVVYAILLQRRELSLQRDELRLTRQELQRAADAQFEAADLHKQELSVMKKQLSDAEQERRREVAPVLVLEQVTSSDNRKTVAFRNVGGSIRQAEIEQVPQGVTIRMEPSHHIDRSGAGRFTLVLSDESERLLKFRVRYTDELGKRPWLDVICDPWRSILQSEVAEDNCYLTTACVEYAGLPDDCRELTQMRAFRDEFLLKTDLGLAIAYDYYERAPTILAAIREAADVTETFGWIREEVQRTGELHKAEDSLGALKTYLGMVKHLEDRFVPVRLPRGVGQFEDGLEKDEPVGQRDNLQNNLDPSRFP